MDKTIEYYNQNADMFVQGICLVDFTVVTEKSKLVKNICYDQKDAEHRY